MVYFFSDTLYNSLKINAYLVLYLCSTVFEGRHHDAACRAGHTLHIAQNKRSSYAVRFAGASPCDDNGSVRADKLREALGLVKVNFFLGHRRCRFLVYQGIKNQVQGRIPQIPHLQYQ